MTLLSIRGQTISLSTSYYHTIVVTQKSQHVPQLLQRADVARWFIGGKIRVVKKPALSTRILNPQSTIILVYVPVEYLSR
jgi:hypothetical protein